MIQTTTPLRRFCVRSVTEIAACARLVEGVSFEDAAVRFVEDHHADGGPDHDVSLDVEDLATGERQCFTVDLATGDAEPCG